MSRIEPLDMAQVPALEPLAAFYAEKLGFVPNGLRIMARRPALVEAFVAFRAAVVDPATSTVDVELKELVGNIASRAAGCRYCQAHTALGADRGGVAPERLAALWDYRTSELFDDAERAALDLALAAAAVPNLVDDDLMARVRDHYDDGQVVELLAVIGLYGFLNRWNDSLATELEEPSREVAQASLGPAGWTIGAHASADAGPVEG